MQVAEHKFDKGDIPKTLWFGSKALKFPCTTAATALIYWHRFSDYAAGGDTNCQVLKLSSETDHIILCSAILFLAGKATEYIRRIREVVNVVRLLFGYKPEEFDLNEVRTTVSFHFIFKLKFITHSAPFPFNNVYN
jgi:hypothetical protein